MGISIDETCDTVRPGSSPTVVRVCMYNALDTMVSEGTLMSRAGSGGWEREYSNAGGAQATAMERGAPKRHSILDGRRRQAARFEFNRLAP